MKNIIIALKSIDKFQFIEQNKQTPTDIKICRGYLFVYSGVIINQLTIISTLNLHTLCGRLFLFSSNDREWQKIK